MDKSKTMFNTYEKLSKNLTGIMCGDYDKEIGLEYLEKVKHIGFLLNNFTINLDTDESIFEYEDFLIKIRGVKNSLEHTHNLEFESYIITLFLKQEDFLLAYKKFERGFRLNKIIN